MSEHIYKHIRLTGSSKKGSDDAVKNAIDKAAKTVKKLTGLKCWKPAVMLMMMRFNIGK